MSDFVTWVNNTAIILTTVLPLQSLDSALNYVNAYLSDTGGWIPNDPMMPLGEGLPAVGGTEQDAAEAILDAQFLEVYDVNFNVGLTINVQMAAKLGIGLDITGATTAMSAMVESFITDRINDSILPLRVTTDAMSVSADPDLSDLTGQTSPEMRVAIAAGIAGDDKLVDYKMLALKYAQDTYGIDNTWNVQYIYREITGPIVVTIAHYTDDSTWATLDGGTTQIYVFSISPDTYQIVTGAIIDQGS